MIATWPSAEHPVQLPGTWLVVVNTVGSIIVFALPTTGRARAARLARVPVRRVPAGIAIQAVPSIVGTYLARARALPPSALCCCSP